MSTYHSSKLSNGLHVVSRTFPNIDGVAISLWTRAGSRYEGKDELGYAHVLEHLLLSGTEHYPTNLDIANAIEASGGYINAWTGRDNIRFYIVVPKYRAEEAFYILSDIIFNPKLRAEDLEKDKEIVKREIRRTMDNPQRWASHLAYISTFNGHQLANDPLGSENSVKRANISTIKAHKEKFFVPGRSAIIVSGGLNSDEVLKLTEKHFKDWSGSDAIEIDKSNINREGKYFFEKRNIKETQLRFSFIISPAGAVKDNLVVEMIGNYLCSGMGSLLHQEIRERMRLVYSVNYYIYEYSDTGIFGISTSTESPEEVIRVVKDIFSSLAERFSADVVQAMKAKMIGMYKLDESAPLALDRMGREFIARNAVASTDDFIKMIESIDVQEFKDVAKKYLNPDNLSLVALGPDSI